jgi:transposase
MPKKTINSCRQCQRLQAQVEALTLRLQQLQATVAQLQEQLAAARKDSSTSSKPSSDIVKPPPPPPPLGQDQRLRGAQPGHPKHERSLFPPEQLTHAVEHTLAACPCCGGPLRRNGQLARGVQQVDIDQVPLTIEQHTAPEYWCVRCQRPCKAALPAPVEAGGLLGPRLTVLVAYLKGVCHASHSTIRKFLRDVVALTISRGQLAKVIAKVSAALEGPYGELLDALPEQTILNVDETGHKDQGRLLWTWCFRASLDTLFKIDTSRSADVLIDVLGEEFDGVLGCDYFGAYRRFHRQFDVRVQFCLAHLIREVKYLTTLPDRATRAYGERFREALRRLFGVIHEQSKLSAATFRLRLEAARTDVLRQATQDVPASRAAVNLASRLHKYGECYFRFLTTADLEPTNNAAEQAIRFVVIDRHITQGTRGQVGQRWCERIWTVLATCAQQGRDVWSYLEATVRAHWSGQPVPSLLPES